MRNIIIVTGGAGFIGSNLIELLLRKTSYRIVSLDNYSTGNKKNHIFNKRVKYLKGDTINFNKIFNKIRNNIRVIFHFAEFSRIAQSFDNLDKCFKSNILGSHEVINFCLNNNIKIVYSATSASLGNNQNDQHLSPYAFTKSTNMNLIMNLNEWYKLKYEMIYFYNVYGPKQILKTNMAAVIGVFVNQFRKKMSLTVVYPGNQKRRFTHVSDTVFACYYAWKKNKNAHYSISSKESYSIIQVARFFSNNIKYLKSRKGERFVSTIVKSIRGKKIINLFGKINLKNYIDNYKKLVNNEAV
jgi:UDP-glucose 4-epimerase